MLKSFCIKTNNKKIINYLLNEFGKINSKNLYVSNKKFKIYNNIIIHYKGKDIKDFYNTFSNILSSCIINFYEKRIIKQIINFNYFYFTDIEQRKIYDIVLNYLNKNEIDECLIRKSSINISCTDYISNNKSLILEGFVNFRLKNYIKIIDYIVDLAVNKFIIDREYLEFIDVLKSYINSKNYKTSLVHLIYNSGESTLLDEFKNIIDLQDSVLNNNIVSDISFSSNDYTLNALLTLLPQKICIHVLDNNEDEFINTLKLIFDKRIIICTDCNLCKAYKLEEINKL